MIIRPPESIQVQVSDVLSILKNYLGASIQAVHLFGSAVDGGLKPSSDIDLLVTVNSPLSESGRAALMRELLSVSAFPGTDVERRALEVTVLAYEDVMPWRYPARRQMQFGEWLRDDIAEGIFESAMTDHDLAILLSKVRRHSIALYGPAAQAFFDEVPAIDMQRALLQTLSLWTTEEDWIGDERNIVLALARIWYTAMTRDIASKDAAADWALERLLARAGLFLLRQRDSYLGLETVDLANYPQERAELLDYIRSSVKSKLC